MRLLIGFGGNLGDVSQAFSRALAALGVHLRVVAVSGLWRTKAHGPPQPDFLNAAALLESAEHPLAVHALCRRLEDTAGRDRLTEQRWGPRTLDLDLLITPGLVIEAPNLVLPHPRLAGRRFALAPAAELAPDWLHPRLHRTLSQLAAAPEIAAQRCDRVSSFDKV